MQRSSFKRAFTQDELDAVMEVMAGIHGFGFRLLHEMASRQPEKNILVAPFTVAKALAVAANGAVGKSRQEIVEAMGIPALSDEMLRLAYAFLLMVLAGNCSGELKTACSLWISKEATLLPRFLEESRDSFDAEVANLDFDSPDAVKTINSWIENQTNGQHRDFLPTVDANALLYLLTTFVYAGFWTKPFKTEETHPEPFYLQNGQRKTVPMMSAAGIYPIYWEDEGFQAVGLDLDAITFYVLLPDEGVSPEEIVARLNVNDWKEPTGAMKAGWEHEDYKVDLKMPRFQSEWRGDLISALRGLGVNCVFERDCADFSRLAQGHTWVSEVGHGAELEVDEKGVRASALVDVGMPMSAHLQPLKRTMVINRPFIAVLRCTRARSPLLMGIIRDPDSGAAA